MDHDEVLALFDRQSRREARPDGPGARVERDGDVVRQVGPPHAWNGVLWSGLDEESADAAVARQVRFFGDLGLGFEWKLYAHDRPADLADRLLAAGFAAEPAETVMVARIADLDTTVEPPDGVRLVPVTDVAGVESLAEVHELAFGTDSGRLRDHLLARLSDDTVVPVLAVADGRPVSAARLDLTPGTSFAGLWGGGTVPGWRGRGLYRALIAWRARRAADRGYDYLQVDASDQSRPILLGLGFVPLTTTTPYVRP
ncbi:GNAT family N-acetyltransferase [Nonomuraea sp. NPDC049607]|uniref:GNAT family N-acetyltransferase n=1 Tax=Nonomuraea sp. NPDC049607 TaxID=3154732 RepID=UPI00341F1679